MSPASGVVAVVPVFRPGRSITRNITVLAEQVARVVVVDDGSGTVADEVLGELAARGVQVLRLGSNAGIARALNAGVERALGDPSVDFVLTLDQDSTVCPGFVDAALRTFAQHGAQGRVGVVSPSRVSGGAVRTGGTSGTETMPLEPMQSGMVIARRTFEAVGPFREEFFIDCVDVDFFLRAARAGWMTVVGAGCEIEHELGELKPTLPGRAGFSYHGPVRRYFMTRNRLVVVREHGWAQRQWLRRTLPAEVEGLLLSLVFGPQRLRQALSVVAGTLAFLGGRSGEMSAGLRVLLSGRARTD